MSAPSLHASWSCRRTAWAISWWPVRRDVVLGRTPAYHDLTALAGALRSHGGRYEEMVPLIFSEPLNAAYAARAVGDVRNFDIFEFTCNGTH